MTTTPPLSNFVEEGGPPLHFGYVSYVSYLRIEKLHYKGMTNIRFTSTSAHGKRGS
jgi:hypothetical protein